MAHNRHSCETCSFDRCAQSGSASCLPGFVASVPAAHAEWMTRNADHHGHALRRGAVERGQGQGRGRHSVGI